MSGCDVATCLDTGHARLSGDLDGVFHKLSSHLQMVHINDNPGDWDAHLLPGEGSIDWAWVADQLDHCEFGGGLIIEMAARENESVHTTLDRSRRGREFLAAVLEAQTGKLASIRPRQKAASHHE